jgi:COP9 signalosome complex subunit 7
MEANQASTSVTNSSNNKLEHFLAVGRTVESSAAAMELIRTATAEPGLLAFQELSELPAVKALAKAESQEARAMFNLLLTFAYGTWSSYVREQSQLPSISPAHELKLKQLSMITLAEQNKALPYSLLMSELEVKDVRELEDFLINNCMYPGCLSGKLDQKQRVLEIEYAVGRDVSREQLDELISSLEDWLGVSDNLLQTIQSQLDWASATAQAKLLRQKEIAEKVKDVKKNIRTEIEMRGQTQDTTMAEQSPGVDAMDEDRPGSTRTKRRR